MDPFICHLRSGFVEIVSCILYLPEGLAGFCLPYTTSACTKTSYNSNRLVTPSEIVGLILNIWRLGMTASRWSMCDLRGSWTRGELRERYIVGMCDLL